MVSIIFTEQALRAPCMKLETLEKRLSQLESEVDLMDQMMWYM